MDALATFSLMSRTHRITILAGDGIGPEVMVEAVRILEAAEAKFGFSVSRSEHLVGGAAIDADGVPLTDETLAAAKAADAALKSRGLIMRAMGGYGLPACLRISIGTGEECQMVADAITSFMAQHG